MRWLINHICINLLCEEEVERYNSISDRPSVLNRLIKLTDSATNFSVGPSLAPAQAPVISQLSPLLSRGLKQAHTGPEQTSSMMKISEQAHVILESANGPNFAVAELL